MKKMNKKVVIGVFIICSMMLSGCFKHSEDAVIEKAKEICGENVSIENRESCKNSYNGYNEFCYTIKTKNTGDVFTIKDHATTLFDITSYTLLTDYYNIRMEKVCERYIENNNITSIFVKTTVNCGFRDVVISGEYSSDDELLKIATDLNMLGIYLSDTLWIVSPENYVLRYEVSKKEDKDHVYTSGMYLHAHSSNDIVSNVKIFFND